MDMILSLGDEALIRQMTSDGFLKDWTNLKCSHCGLGDVAPLQEMPRGGWGYRCKRRGCQKFILPHAGHPVFKCSWGQSSKSLRQQMKTLFGLVIGLSVGQHRLLWGDNEKYINAMSQRLDAAREKYVLKRAGDAL